MILSKKQMNHYTSEGYKMKKHNRLKKIIEKIAIRAAISEANTTCPFINYQPEIPKAVKKLRKFERREMFIVQQVLKQYL